MKPVKDSLGELKIRVANDIELIERVDPEEEQRAKREEKVLRIKEKMAKKKELQKMRKRNKKEEDGEDPETLLMSWVARMQQRKRPWPSEGCRCKSKLKNF